MTDDVSECACCTAIIETLVRALLAADEALGSMQGYQDSDVHRKISDALSEHDELIYSIQKALQPAQEPPCKTCGGRKQTQVLTRNEPGELPEYGWDDCPDCQPPHA